MTIQAIVTQAQASIKAAVHAIKSAPPYPMDGQINQLTSLAYADNIRVSTNGGFVLTFFDLVIDVMTPHKKTDDNMRQLEGIVEAIADVFTDDPTISGKCQTFNGEITGNIVTQDLQGGIPVIGYRIKVPNIKF